MQALRLIPVLIVLASTETSAGAGPRAIFPNGPRARAAQAEAQIRQLPEFAQGLFPISVNWPTILRPEFPQPVRNVVKRIARGIVQRKLDGLVEFPPRYPTFAIGPRGWCVPWQCWYGIELPEPPSPPIPSPPIPSPDPDPGLPIRPALRTVPGQIIDGRPVAFGRAFSATPGPE